MVVMQTQGPEGRHLRRKLASRASRRHGVHEHLARNTKTSVFVLQTLADSANISVIVRQTLHGFFSVVGQTALKPPYSPCRRCRPDSAKISVIVLQTLQ